MSSPADPTFVLDFHYGDHVKGRYREGTLVPRPEDANPGVGPGAVWIKFDDSGVTESRAPYAFVGGGYSGINFPRECKVCNGTGMCPGNHMITIGCPFCYDGIDMRVLRRYVVRITHP
jgi:hypothetical protein